VWGENMNWIWALKIFCILVGVICMIRGLLYSITKHKNGGNDPVTILFNDSLLFRIASSLIFRFLPWWITAFLWMLFGVGWVCLGIFIKTT
jgi:hypothetical protein